MTVAYDAAAESNTAEAWFFVLVAGVGHREAAGDPRPTCFTTYYPETGYTNQTDFKDYLPAIPQWSSDRLNYAHASTDPGGASFSVLDVDDEVSASLAYLQAGVPVTGTVDEYPTMLAVDATRVRWPEHQGLSLFGAHPDGHPLDYETRNIAPSSGMSEDPITGSLNAAIACWLLSQNRLPDTAIAAQGTNLGRTGRVQYRRDPARPGAVLIGGAVNILIEGTLEL